MFLGIDLGTSEVKLVLLDDEHRIVGRAGEALTVQRPLPLWSEQDPAAWWAATERAAARLREQHGSAWRAVRAIGLSGQMHGAVLLDERDDVLRPAILWNDGRSGVECAVLEAAAPDLRRVAANIAMPGFTAPKLLWVRKHEPEVFARTRRVLLPKDWLRLKLSGEAVSDMSDASGTLWLDVAARAWSPDLLAACALGVEHMPRLVEGSQVGGVLRGDVAQAWGLKAGIPIAGGGGDNAASAVGIGAVRPGQGFVSLGTSGVIFLAGDHLQPNPARAVHAFCHALPGRWHQMTVMLSAAACLQWVTRLTGAANEAELLTRVSALDDGRRDRAPIFLPYLSGERTPHNNPHARGVLFGLEHDHDAASLGYAVIEGVAFGLRDGWSSLGVEHSAVRALSLVGGGSRSALWADLLASALGVTLVTHTGGEAGGALGAARLAWLAAGGDESTVCAMPPVAAEHAPRPAWATRLDARYARFQQLYPSLVGAYQSQ
jgi:xylulokinase